MTKEPAEMVDVQKIDPDMEQLDAAWRGKSPGPAAMQSKQTPLEKRIDTPDKEWEELLQDQINDWVTHIKKIGNLAPKTNIAQRRIVHNVRELAEQAMTDNNAETSRFRCIKKSNKMYETPQTKVIKPIYSPSSGGSSGNDADGGDVNNFGPGGDGNGDFFGDAPDDELDDEQHTRIQICQV